MFFIQLKQTEIFSEMSQDQLDQSEYLDAPFELSVEELSDIVNFDRRTDKDLVNALNDLHGGVEGIVTRLKSDTKNGIPLRFAHQSHTPSSNAKKGSNGPDMTALDGAERSDIFGENIIPPPRSDTILEIIWGTIVDDPILKILILGAVIVLGLGSALCPSAGWIEVNHFF